jgi:hypothetical protein
MTTVVYGLNTGDDFNDVEDTWTFTAVPTTNFASSSPLITERNSGSNYDLTAFLRMSDLSDIPSGSTINSVITTLFKQSGNNTTTNAYRVLQAAVYSQLTYNVYSTGNNWSTAGGSGSGTDRAASSSGSFAFGFLNDLPISATDGGLIDDVQDWLDGAATNGGWILLLAADDAINIHGCESSDGLRPYITVDYTAGGGTTRGTPFGHRGTAFNGGRTFHGVIQ